MTFDEAIDRIDVNGTLIDTLGVLQALQQEYAPTVEMTQEQHDYIDPLIQEGKELGATFTEFWEVYKYMGASKKLTPAFKNQEQAMQAWLHPETIKIV
ncbi:hypothetical protein KQ236_15440, partial [Lactococcus lactis]|nr:hypothetical protein [Lactococcus lactis]